MYGRYTVRTLVREAVLLLCGFVFAIPLLGLVNLSLQPAVRSGGLLTPGPVTVANYVRAWNDANLGLALINSLSITTASVIVIVLISSFAAYPLARITRRWSRWTFAGIVGGLLVPAQLALLPLYTTMRYIGLVGTLPAVVIISVGTNLPFSIFLYTTFIREIPTDYEEAAILDGCGPIRSFISVLFPLLRPVTGTIIILNVVGIWNDFFTPLLYLSGTGTVTAPLAIYGFVSQYVTNWPLIFAGLVITVIPILLVYFSLQKYVIRGFAGGLKG